MRHEMIASSRSDSTSAGSESGSGSGSGSSSASSSSSSPRSSSASRSSDDDGDDGASASGSSARSSGELVSALGARLRLPRDMCSNPDLFRSVVSAAAWARLTDAECRHLRRFLPDFEVDDAREKDATLRRLFAGAPFRFGSPLVEFARRLARGAYRPEAQRLERAERRAGERLARKRRRRAWRDRFPRVLAARERLLAEADGRAPTPPREPKKRGGGVARRAAIRYARELAAVRDGTSPPPPSYGLEVPLDDRWRRRALALHVRQKRARLERERGPPRRSEPPPPLAPPPVEANERVEATRPPEPPKKAEPPPPEAEPIRREEKAVKPSSPPPPPPPPGPPLVQATHACFLSVVRDLVCSTPHHRLPLHALESLLRAWRQNPIAPLNRWYNAVEDWPKALPSAVAFLTGEDSGQSEDFVPYMQYKAASQMYQWIGAGRDSDTLLLPLCARWLSRRKAETLPSPAPPAPIKNSSPSVAPVETIECLSSQTNPKWNSKWQVSAEELEAFRTQEVLRFQRPHRSFTYRLPRGEIVVGPLKGVYGCDEPGTGPNRVARGHTLLTSTRPRHVTLLALVRDAVACLPSGEGTRAHIAALVRRSQYIVDDAQEQPLQAAVSGALDRMHGSPDPCVHYLPARKLWVYLHGNRTEEEFERLHAEMQIQSKNKTMANLHQKKNASGKSKSSKASKSAKPPIPPEKPEVVSNSTVHIEEEVDVEDMNIDVEGPELPVQAAPVQTASTSVSQLDNKINNAILSGTSLLQPRPPVFTTQQVLKRGAEKAQNSRSVVRVLSSTSSTGKSLISPNALQPTTSQSAPSATVPKLVVQRSTKQTSGSLSCGQQKRLLESIVKPHKHHVQNMPSEQILHTVHATQKTASPPVSASASTAYQSKSPTISHQTLQLASQTVQLPSGQTVQLAAGQTVQLSGGQTLQTVQIGNQTMQLTGGQSIQLISQSRPGVDAGSPMPRQPSGPLVAKLLTSAQLRNTNNSGGSSPTAGLRLSLAQLQGKPLLLQANSPQNKSQNIFLQKTSGSASPVNPDQRPTGPRSATPGATQHTLLLGNLGGQVVRVAGSSTLLGSALRLQTPGTGVQGAGGMILGGHTLKLQASPVRLHQNTSGNAAPNRVLLTGTRLHELKILPVNHPMARGSSGRQVYARIVSPSNANPGVVNNTSGVQNVVKSSPPASTGSAQSTPNPNPAPNSR